MIGKRGLKCVYYTCISLGEFIYVQVGLFVFPSSPLSLKLFSKSKSVSSSEFAVILVVVVKVAQIFPTLCNPME